INLFVKGIVDDKLLINYLAQEGKYVINRSSINSIFKEFDSGIKFQIITSNLGNGKSVLVRQLSITALSQGYKVFLMKDYGRNFEKELDRIINLPEFKIIVIENYNLYLKSLRILKYSNLFNTKIIFTARTYINDSFYSELINST